MEMKYVVPDMAQSFGTLDVYKRQGQGGSDAMGEAVLYRM